MGLRANRKRKNPHVNPFTGEYIVYTNVEDAIERDIREQIAQQIEAVELEELNAVGMKYIAARIARGLPVGIERN